MSSFLTIPTPSGPMEAYFACPDGAGPHPAIVVVQEAFGVNRYLRGVVDSLAREGYVALAPELFHRSGTHVEVPYSDMGQAIAIFEKIGTHTIEEDVGAALEVIRARADVDPTRIGVLGFCLGGYAAILAGLTRDVAAVVAFYPGTLVRPHPRLSALTPLVERMPALRPRTLCQFGERDQAITADDLAAIRAALDQAPGHHEVVVHPNAGHGFHTQDRTTAYEPVAAAQAWQRTLAWFAAM